MENRLKNRERYCLSKIERFKIGHLNIASLPKHIEELEVLLKRYLLIYFALTKQG
jgi:hypothetical protein